MARNPTCNRKKNNASAPRGSKGVEELVVRSIAAQLEQYHAHVRRTTPPGQLLEVDLWDLPEQQQPTPPPPTPTPPPLGETLAFQHGDACRLHQRLEALLGRSVSRAYRGTRLGTRMGTANGAYSFSKAKAAKAASGSSSKEEESKEKPKKNGERALVSQNLPAVSKPCLSAGVIGSGQP